MAFTKKVLLARPHALIVSNMLPFLENADFIPTTMENLNELNLPKLGGFSGAIISTAVFSSVGAKAEDVFVALRKVYPRLPVIFAGLTEFPEMKSAVERIVRRLYPNAVILPITTATEGHPGLGRDNVFLALRKEDVDSGEAAMLTERILRKHFK